MTENTPKFTEQKSSESAAPPKLNEYAGFYLSTHIKITDPNTGQVLVQKRGDS